MTTQTTILAATLLLLSGCAMCPSMDDNCWLIRTMNGEDTGPGRATPEEACGMRGGHPILKAGEYDRCTDGK